MLCLLKIKSSLTNVWCPPVSRYSRLCDLSPNPHRISTAYRDVAPGTSASYQIELVVQTEGYLWRNSLWLVCVRSPVRIVIRSSAVRTGYWGFFSSCGQTGDTTLSQGGRQISQKSVKNLKILGVRRVIRGNVFTEVAQMLGATLKNLVTQVLCTPALR